jgi:hypothetical protein
LSLSRETMFRLFFEKWREFYVGETRRAGRIAKTGLSYIRSSDNGTLSPAITETGENLLELGQTIFGNSALTQRMAKAIELSPDQIDACLAVSLGILESLTFSPPLAAIHRTYLTFLDNAYSGILRGAAMQRQWSRFLFLTLSNTVTFHIAKRRTRLRRTTFGELRPALKGNDLYLAEVHSRLAHSAQLGRSLGGPTAARFSCVLSELLGSGEQGSNGRERSLPARSHFALESWLLSHHQFSEHLAKMLDRYSVGRQWEIGTESASLPTSDEQLYFARDSTDCSPEQQFEAEHFVDTTITSVINNSKDLDKLARHLGYNSPYLTKLLKVLACHFFTNRRVLADLARSGQIEKYPGRGWQRRAELWAQWSERRLKL